MGVARAFIFQCREPFSLATVQVLCNCLDAFIRVAAAFPLLAAQVLELLTKLKTSVTQLPEMTKKIDAAARALFCFEPPALRGIGLRHQSRPS